jgi:hypothetical protein
LLVEKLKTLVLLGLGPFSRARQTFAREKGKESESLMGSAGLMHQDVLRHAGGRARPQRSLISHASGVNSKERAKLESRLGNDPMFNESYNQARASGGGRKLTVDALLRLPDSWRPLAIVAAAGEEVFYRPKRRPLKKKGARKSANTAQLRLSFVDLIPESY